MTRPSWPTPEEVALQKQYFEVFGPVLEALTARFEREMATPEGRARQEQYEKDHPCVGSGWCCKQALCPYGVLDLLKGHCAHLIPWPGEPESPPRYRCERYDYIRTQPDWEMMPAFGGGCVHPGNPERAEVLVTLRRKSEAK